MKWMRTIKGCFLELTMTTCSGWKIHSGTRRKEDRLILASLRCWRLWPTLYLILSVFVMSPTALAAGDYRFQKENLALIRDVDNLLVSNGLCPDMAHCSSNQIVFTESTSRGLDVEIYGITDPKIIQQIDSICAEYFYRSDAISIRIHFFAVTKTEEVQDFLFFKPKPIVIVYREHIHVKEGPHNHTFFRVIGGNECGFIAIGSGFGANTSRNRGFPAPSAYCGRTAPSTLYRTRKMLASAAVTNTRLPFLASPR